MNTLAIIEVNFRIFLIPTKCYLSKKRKDENFINVKIFINYIYINIYMNILYTDSCSLEYFQFI